MKSRFQFFILLFAAFLDYAGVGLVFPLFAGLLFDPQSAILGVEATSFTRGIWMGVLIALTPLVQFFASPLLGSLSDQKGRKGVMNVGLLFGVVAYLFGVLGVKMGSLSMLLLYRALFGVSSATMTVVQASIVDVSTPETKPKNFGLYNMALGTGFTFGPFLGGRLSDSSVVSWFDYSTPFACGALLTLLSLILFVWKFKETRQKTAAEPLDLLRGVRHIRRAVTHPTLKFAFLAFFFFVSGWDYFIEFSPVFLKAKYGLSTSQVGTIYAYKGLLYALSVGVLIRPFVSRVSGSKLLITAMFSAGIYLLGFLFVEETSMLWLYLPLLNFFMALFYPVASTYISNRCDENSQGEILGVYHSIQAVALIISPLLSGALIAASAAMPVYLGSMMMLLGGCVFTASYFWKRSPAQAVDEID